MKLYSRALLRRNINTIQLPGAEKKKAVHMSDGGEFVFRKVGVQRVLQFLKDNGGAEIFSHIVIIAEKTAGRGINFVSTDFEW